MGIGVAALEDEGDAANHRNHRKDGDNEDLSALPIAGIEGGATGTLHGVLVACSKRGSPGHGCLGHAAAATPSDRLGGQLYSTGSTDFDVKVIPFLKMMLLMSGVIGW